MGPVSLAYRVIRKALLRAGDACFVQRRSLKMSAFMI
jgi:hypothetical protein